MGLGGEACTQTSTLCSNLEARFVSLFIICNNLNKRDKTLIVNPKLQPKELTDSFRAAALTLRLVTEDAL